MQRIQEWEAYRRAPEFREDFTLAQRAFATGDLAAIASRLAGASRQRAFERAASTTSRRRNDH